MAEEEQKRSLLSIILKTIYWISLWWIIIEPIRLLVWPRIIKPVIVFSGRGLARLSRYIRDNIVTWATNYLFVYPACVGILSIPIGFVYGGFSFDEYRQYYQSIGGTPLDLYGLFLVLGIFFPIFARGLAKSIPDAVGAVVEVKDAIEDQAMSKKTAANASKAPERSSSKREGKDEGSSATSFGAIKYLLFAPGYLTLAVAYFFPNESFSKDRNVAASARQWRRRDFFAVVTSLAIYFFIYVFFLAK